MKLRLCFILLIVSFSAYSNAGDLKKLSLNKIIEMSEAIGLLKVIAYKEYSDDSGVIYKKHLTMEVIDPIYNLEKGQLITLYGFNGISGSDLNLNNVGLEAIIAMNLIYYEETNSIVYNAVGARFSVFRKNENGCIEGLGFFGTNTSYREAKSKIEKKLKNLDLY